MENKNLNMELELECLDYRIELANEFSDIENENDRFAAIKNLYLFIDNFGPEIANLDKKNFGEMVNCYKQFSMGQNLDKISFKDCNKNQKLAAIMAMRANGLKCDKETFKKWVNESKFTPELKAFAFYSLFSIEQCGDWTLKDLEKIGIADWPEQAKYNLIQNLVYENGCKNNNLGDVNDAGNLLNNSFFKSETPEIKRLLTLKMFSNKNKNKNNKKEYLTADIQKILEDGEIDDINKYQLRVDLYNNYGFKLKSIYDYIYPLNEDGCLNLRELTTYHKYGYKNMPSGRKLMALLQVNDYLGEELGEFD